MESTIDNAWERWLPVWHRSFLVLIGLTTLLALIDPTTLPEYHPLLAALSAILFVGHLIGLRFFTTRGERTVLLAVYIVVSWALWYLLTSLSNAYFLLLFMFFPNLFLLIPMPWAIAVAFALSILVLLQLNSTDSELMLSWMPVMVFMAITGGVLAYFINDIINQSEERRNLIKELETTREDLARSQHEAGILHERQRIAGELHDTITQSLIGIVMQLDSAQLALNTDACNEHLQQAKTIARDSINEARRFIWEMQPITFENLTFEEGLKQIVDTWVKSTRIPAEFTVTGQCAALSSEAKIAILRVVQESLANVAKHAQAKQATVTISYMPDIVVVDVYDDGVGFDASVKQGFGLTNMRRRIEKFEGTLTIESTVGEGTTIVAEFPIAKVSDEPTHTHPHR